MRVYALLGNPVAHSLSPLMHNAALKEMGIPGYYVPLCVRNLPLAVQGLRGLDIRGASVTIPFKTEIMDYLDDVDEEALRIGAVNTLINRDGRLAGYNTDWQGLIHALKEQMEIKGKTVIILGAGGTARAALYGIAREGGHPIIVNRTMGRGREVAQDWGCPCESIEDIARIRADLLINTTPVGMFPHGEDAPVDAALLGCIPWVCDVIYNPVKTQLLKDAEKAGCRTLNGLAMFIHQGAEQLRLWTGETPPIALMQRVVKEKLHA